MITSHVKYIIDPYQITAFERYSRQWVGLVARLGASTTILLAHNPLHASVEVGEWEDIELWGIVLHNTTSWSR